MVSYRNICGDKRIWWDAKSYKPVEFAEYVVYCNKHTSTATWGGFEWILPRSVVIECFLSEKALPQKASNVTKWEELR